MPDGMQRIGYDSDTHNYRFRDGAGNVFEGGESGGELRLVERASDKAKFGESVVAAGLLR